MSRLDSIGEASDGVSLVRSRRTTLDSAYDLYAADAFAEQGGPKSGKSEQTADVETTLAPSLFALSLSTGFGGSFDDNLTDIQVNLCKTACCERSSCWRQPMTASVAVMALQ